MDIATIEREIETPGMRFVRYQELSSAVSSNGLPTHVKRRVLGDLHAKMATERYTIPEVPVLTTYAAAMEKVDPEFASSLYERLFDLTGQSHYLETSERLRDS